jgi:hypothetical protein
MVNAGDAFACGFVACFFVAVVMIVAFGVGSQK